MTKKQKLNLLNLVLKQLSHNHSLRKPLYTCYIVEDLCGSESDELHWYRNEIKYFYDNHSKFCDEFIEISDFKNNSEDKIKLIGMDFKMGAPFMGNDYINRVKLLKYLIKYYSNYENKTQT